MKCPVCQHVIKDGQVYCEKCGYEIQIVPEFEAELENNIIENMSEVIQELAPEEGEDFEIVDLEESVSYDEDYDDIYERPSVTGFLFKIIKVLFVAVAVLFVVYFWNLDQKLLGWVYKQVNLIFDHKKVDILF